MKQQYFSQEANGRGAIWVSLLFLGLASLGCGGREGLAPVSGRVTINGRPVEGLGITFTPLDQPQVRPSVGTCDANGNYTLMFTSTEPGGTIGRNRVSIIQTDSPEGDVANDVPRVPPEFGDESTLEYEVKPGSNTNVDFDLKIP